MAPNPYHSPNSLRSADVVVPLLYEYLQPRSVLDLGCKHGEWLSRFRSHGAEVVLGYDQQKRADRGLLISPAEFRVADLNRPLDVPGRFDLAVCIEVAEHLLQSSAERLVATLTSAAPVVLFSAALPGQGGHGHYNEQFHEYWHALFARHGFAPIDCLRPKIWQDKRVAYWYRQNMYLYANQTALAQYPRLRDEARRETAGDLELIHVDALKTLIDGQGLTGAVRRVLGTIRAKIAGFGRAPHAGER